MKRNYMRLFCLSTFIVASIPGFSQKYKSIEDTIKLNKEIVNVSNDIVELNAKLTIAQNDLPGYQSKAKNANDDAINAASASSDQAAKATSGGVKETRKAKSKANKAYNEAKDFRSATDKVSNQQDKITRYKLDIKKKQQRLEELNVMRIGIYGKIQTDSIPLIQQ